MVFCFVQHKSQNIFFCRAKRKFDFQNLPLGYMTKTLNEIIFSSTKIRIFFSATLGIRIFFQNKNIPPLQVKWSFPKWNLKVNIGKTKVIVLNKSRRILKGFSFLYVDEPISLTNEYKYLGILFKPSGTFSDAIDYLSKKACKAMFCIRKNLYSKNCLKLV